MAECRRLRQCSPLGRRHTGNHPRALPGCLVRRLPEVDEATARRNGSNDNISPPMNTAAVRFPEFGFYALPGNALDPTEAIEEITTGEELGLGSVWLSERFNTKNV